MPELPEVEVVRLFLQSHIVGKTISTLEILNQKSFLGNFDDIKNQKIINTSRVGKQLSLYLQNNLILLFHLKMTGQVVYEGVSLGHPTPKEDKTNLPNKSTRLIFTFSDQSKLFFNDQRKFGWVKLLDQSKLHESQKNLGVDLLSPQFTPKYFYNQLQSSSRVIKQVLLDQSKFAGIGNIYANDALFLSHIHPQTISRQITLSQSKILRSHLLEIIKESISQGGSTAKDNKYVHPDGSHGQHQFHFRVYQRSGEPCLQCQSLIKKIKIGNRGTFYCPQCQKPLVK